MAVNLEDIFPMFEAWLDPIRCSYCFDSALDWMFTLNNIWINFWDGTWTSSFEIIVTFRVFSFFSHIFRLFFFSVFMVLCLSCLYSCSQTQSQWQIPGPWRHFFRQWSTQTETCSSCGEPEVDLPLHTHKHTHQRDSSANEHLTFTCWVL